MLLCTKAAVWGGASQASEKKRLLSSKELSYYVMASVHQVGFSFLVSLFFSLRFLLGAPKLSQYVSGRLQTSLSNSLSRARGPCAQEIPRHLHPRASDPSKPGPVPHPAPNHPPHPCFSRVLLSVDGITNPTQLHGSEKP